MKGEESALCNGATLGVSATFQGRPHTNTKWTIWLGGGVVCFGLVWLLRERQKMKLEWKKEDLREIGGRERI